MVLDRGDQTRSAEGQDAAILHAQVSDLADFIEPGTVMVFNDSRVRKARIYGRIEGRDEESEFLLTERRQDGSWEFICRGMAKLKDGVKIDFPTGMRATIRRWPVETEPILIFAGTLDESYLEKSGHVPLPPYIKRADESQDAERYQTVYSRVVGSSAAPTAGLHFTPELLKRLEAKGILIRFVTLHVGLGTFSPVRTESIEDHKMHEEGYEISEETASSVTEAKREGRAVLAVGTTSLRTLESAWDDEGSRLKAGSDRTAIFIKPGYQFKAVDRLFTNFHTPESTLLMLVCAFAGKERILAAYEAAVRERYRFFSYGDAMLIR
jgi:S-adenosylmethionine:tRNA ribosyltransferase-isomerase